MSAAGQRINLGKPERAEIPRNGEHPQQEPGVTDAVYDECLVGGVAGRLAVKVKANQQVRAQAHPLPAHKHHGVIVPQDQREHGEHEQVQVAEEAVIAPFVRHVAGRIDVDQHADAGHKQQPDTGERIEQEAGISVERSGRSVIRDVIQVAGVTSQPGVQNLLKWIMPVARRPVRVLPNRSARPQERHYHDAHTHGAHRRLLHLAANKKHCRRPKCRQQRNQPDGVQEKHISAASSYLLATTSTSPLHPC